MTDKVEEIAGEVEDRRIAIAKSATVAREGTAAELERLREERAEGVALQREELAAQVAFEKGVVAARLEGRLNSHEDHFARINGSVCSFVAMAN